MWQPSQCVAWHGGVCGEDHPSPTAELADCLERLCARDLKSTASFSRRVAVCNSVRGPRMRNDAARQPMAAGRERRGSAHQHRPAWRVGEQQSYLAGVALLGKSSSSSSSLLLGMAPKRPDERHRPVGGRSGMGDATAPRRQGMAASPTPPDDSRRVMMKQRPFRAVGGDNNRPDAARGSVHRTQPKPSVVGLSTAAGVPGCRGCRRRGAAEVTAPQYSASAACW
jgi:hypothetical protein